MNKFVSGATEFRAPAGARERAGTNRHLYRITSVGSGETIQEHDAYSETSAFSPGVFGVGALQYVAWAGTDAAHRLNIGELSSLTKIEGP